MAGRKRGRKSRGGMGKRKGGAFERYVCKQLSLWVTGGKRQDVFWRSAMSGGRATVSIRKGIDNRQGGDICAVAPEGADFAERYFVECKFIRDLKLGQFITNKQGPLGKFWKKAMHEAGHHKRTPLLTIAQNGATPVLVMSPKGALERWLHPIATIHDFDLHPNGGADIHLFDAWVSTEHKL